MFRKMLISAILAAGCLFAAGPAPTKPQARPAARAAAPRISDADLLRGIQAKFAKSKISVNKFTVAVQNGIATIDGRTDVIQHKATATRLAKSAGATAVVNKVQISEAARQKAAANLSRVTKRTEVKRAAVIQR